jgi:hypothetical protein
MGIDQDGALNMEDAFKIIGERLSQLLDKESLGIAEKILELDGIKEAVEAGKAGYYEDFYDKFLSPVEKLVQGVILMCSANREIRFLFEREDFISSHFEFWIKKVEGRACCVDKTTTIQRALIAYYLKRKPIVFDYTLEYTYHLPKKIFNNQQAIITFYFAVKRLFYGDPIDYFQYCRNILNLLSEDK